jgi:Uma2 family endonuclease
MAAGGREGHRWLHGTAGRSIAPRRAPTMPAVAIPPRTLARSPAPSVYCGHPNADRERAVSVARADLVTADQLLHWPDPDARLELVAGVVHHMTPAGAGHGMIGVRLVVLLDGHVRPRRLGAVFGPDTGFWLRRDPDTVRAPDVAFVAAGRLPPDGVSMRGFLELAPDLAVEIRSPGDRTRGSRAKIAEYLAAGVRQVWVVDPPARAVTAHGPGGASPTAREGEELDGGDVVPGFRCAVAALFEGVART